MCRQCLLPSRRVKGAGAGMRKEFAGEGGGPTRAQAELGSVQVVGWGVGLKLKPK